MLELNYSKTRERIPVFVVEGDAEMLKMKSFFMAFYHCTSLTSIKYRGTEAQWDAVSKGDKWDVYENNLNYYKIDYTVIYSYKGE